MKKPIIGITPGINYEKDDIALSPAYMNCIEECGGVPIILPMTKSKDMIKRCVDMCDGFLFSGGRDISPELYGERTLDICGFVEQERDIFEMQLLREVLGSSKPFLAVCRGIQLLNVYFGGTLYQDIYAMTGTAVSHSMTSRCDDVCHKIKILPRTVFTKIFGSAVLDVNSYHHQAIKDVGIGLCIGAVSPDDSLIEGVYIPGHSFAVGVQWHPELLIRRDPSSKYLFTKFVESTSK